MCGDDPHQSTRTAATVHRNIFPQTTCAPPPMPAGGARDAAQARHPEDSPGAHPGLLLDHDGHPSRIHIQGDLLPQPALPPRPGRSNPRGMADGPHQGPWRRARLLILRCHDRGARPGPRRGPGPTPRQPPHRGDLPGTRSPSRADLGARRRQRPPRPARSLPPTGGPDRPCGGTGGPPRRRGPSLGRCPRRAPGLRGRDPAGLRRHRRPAHRRGPPCRPHPLPDRVDLRWALVGGGGGSGPGPCRPDRTGTVGPRPRRDAPGPPGPARLDQRGPLPGPRARPDRRGHDLRDGLRVDRRRRRGRHLREQRRRQPPRRSRRRMRRPGRRRGCRPAPPRSST